MHDPLLWLVLACAAVGVVLSVISLMRVTGVATDVREELRSGREEARSAARDLREEVGGALRATSETLSISLQAMGTAQQTQLEAMTRQISDLTASNHEELQRIRDAFDARVKELQEGNEKKIDVMRNEVSDGLKTASGSVTKTLEDVGKAQAIQLEAMTGRLKDLGESSQTALERIRNAFDSRVKELQEGNEKKLDEMRRTVDEKLHDALERRLGESFKLVSDRLEAVHKGLGEMQHLATGVGDLKRVLSNVKVRGTWAEVQLGGILEQILTPEQYEKNVRIKPDTESRVEYAVRLPGSKDDPGSPLWLPIDSKFPQEDYLRLQQAAEAGDSEAVDRAVYDLSRTIRAAAKDIHDKYISPPSSTDFAIMFLATEGLYAEVLRQPALVEDLQYRYRVVVAGPTTLAAVLSSLRMGFQTLAIEQRAAEVRVLLGAVKTEFGKFGDVLERVKRQLETATRTMDETGKRSRALERKLRSVEQLSDGDAAAVLGLSSGEQNDAEHDDAEEQAT